ncbi:MAG: ATP-binding protein [Aigarchaeota archaeon]|nr:ATP-binding protein [Aigarchaeota archaeon]MDW8093252.1 ATP-binding protein [Nitrososphaerota archaeon]
MIDWSEIISKIEQVGIVGSPSGDNTASCILHDGMEKVLRDEALVLIDNRNGNKILAVCRKGQGFNEALRYSYYSPGIAYAKTGRWPSSAKEFFVYTLIVIGDITDGVVRQNTLIIAPGSPVYRFNEEVNPVRFLSDKGVKIGYYATGFKTWKVPLNHEYISHHIGVFGITGSGKSYLCRYELIPLLRKVGYDVLIFDWKGDDFARFYKSVISIKDIKLDESTVYRLMIKKFENFGQKYESSLPAHIFLQEIIKSNEWKRATASDTKRKLLEMMKERGEKLTRSDTKAKFEQCLNYVEYVPDEEFNIFLGTRPVSELIDGMLREEHVVVVDQSFGRTDEKLSVFLSFTRYLEKQMEEKKTLNIAVVVDEAPQYCPHNPRGIEEDTTEMISRLAALGRARHLSLVLIAQGMAGEIGINASVRRNLNTLFIGRIHPLDVQEAERFFANSSISSDDLLRLPDGHFYMVGKMNPSPVPILITFEIQKGEEVGSS